jgi:hypothetical protein
MGRPGFTGSIRLICQENNGMPILGREKAV